MFRLKAVVFVAALSVVNAAITVNIYDTGGRDVTGDKEDFQEVHGCTNQVCDQLCRLLSFPGGACDNGRCKCNKMKPTKELVFENDKDLASCNWRAYDQLCRRLGFTGGVCVGDNCKCDNFRLNNKEKVDAKTLQRCDVVACNEMCHRINYIGGMCRNGSCYCY